MVKYLIKAVPFLLILFACAPAKPTTPYVASKAVLEKLQPDREILSARKGCDVCHKIFAERFVYKYYPVRISHKVHSRLGLECVFCHRKAASSTKVDDYLMPEGHGFAGRTSGIFLNDLNPCKVCHIYSSDSERGYRRIPANCDNCHPSYSPGKPVPFKWQRFNTNLKSNHKAHYEKGIPCLRCHPGFDQVEEIVPNFRPKMDICNECHNALEAKESGLKETSDPILKGEGLYRRNCAMCHGMDGKGNGGVTAFFKKGLKPRDLTDHEYISKRTDGHIFWVIFDGGPVLGLSERMPAFRGLLSGGDITLLIKYIRHISREPELP